MRAAVVGFPNVGKSALINRLVGRAQCASAARPGVTRHLQWVTLGAEGSLMLLDAPGVLPMRLGDQAAAVRLAICNDIGEASYTTSLVAAQFIEQLRTHDGASSRGGSGACACADAGCARAVASRRMAALEARYHVDPVDMTGEAYIAALAERSCDGDVERAGRRILVRIRCCAGTCVTCVLMRAARGVCAERLPGGAPGRVLPGAAAARGGGGGGGDRLGGGRPLPPHRARGGAGGAAAVRRRRRRTGRTGISCNKRAQNNAYRGRPAARA